MQETIWFDRYLVLSEIGSGSGSTVYLVRHQKLGEYRAVKRILKNTESAWKIREAEILNYLKHPQIPAVYDIEEDKEAYYMIEEYIEGESLGAYMLQSSFITPEFIHHVILEVAKILDYMHCLEPNPMIYQDLKSDHVIISKGRIKLIDFGIASFLSDSENKFQNYGTPKFCAPEKIKEAKVSIQTDIYSIGILLKELICSGTGMESQYLMHIVKKATDPDLSKRYGSIREFTEDFTLHMQSMEHSKDQEHLLKKIVIAGSQPRIGTTHLSISFTEYFNHQNIFAVYREKNSSDNMRTIMKRGVFTQEGGLYRRGKFLGMPSYGTGVKVDVPKDAIEILDYGSDMEEAMSEEADLFLFIMGSREWEIECSDLSYENIKNLNEIVLISNYGNKDQTKEYAKKYAQTVYCFPLDKNPFFMTKEKEKLFKGLLENERKKNKNSWYCRKRSGKRNHALVRGIGKLCGKRTK